ncbi:hypothetical protein RB614_33105 [Phytohabitans sp. ZYX-F-186]|uniref:PPE family domain-containing protein n=1 Tax=Phytohabitans maris TaxID=3071409 RepID=A0ABU0ZQS2_9ACTN|nr:hypothetical protein [Phytohabitans sp. ZYX-F-186]MDQ7909372.1 hypothetical protein [Phytohabitans sp. ZYX-F-186]
MDANTTQPTGQPRTLDEIVAALAQASPADLHRHADLFDDARRALGEVVDALDRAWTDLEQAWPGAGAVAAAGWEVSRRTRSLLHALDGAACGLMLRMTADTLADGQARLRDLQAQRATGTGTAAQYDEQARLVLHGVSDTYRDIGVRVGGEPPARAAYDETAPLTLAAAGAEAEADELFRPISTVAAGRPGEPALPPAAGGGGAGGSGYPMMPFMPMGGMGGMGGAQVDAAPQQQQRRAGLPGDQGVWGSQESGWQVLGRRERAAATTARERSAALLEELEARSKGDRNG